MENDPDDLTSAAGLTAGARRRLDDAESRDDAARLALLEELHRELTGELERDAEAPSAGR